MMNSSCRKHVGLLVIGGIVAVVSAAVGLLSALEGQAPHVVNLNVPNYKQSCEIWCAAASAQMIMNGYPDAGASKFKDQKDVWVKAQECEQEDAWATDPDGLKGSILAINPPPPPGNWVIFSDAGADVVLFDILYWMTERKYAVATLVWGDDHWVVIKGFETDIDPTTNDAVQLNFIEINNPWNPPNCAKEKMDEYKNFPADDGGVQVNMTANAWFADYWTGPVPA